LTHLDTHVVVWLFAGDLGRLPPAARRRIEGGPIAISPMVELELQYLHEIGRTSRPGREVVADLAGRLGLGRATADFGEVVERAASLGWTRDPFDRMIVATALAGGCPLLTRDESILRNCSTACWEG
jgi:PIN domain nuclease of toxin-antitoxin system